MHFTFNFLMTVFEVMYFCVCCLAVVTSFIFNHVQPLCSVFECFLHLIHAEKIRVFFCILHAAETSMDICMILIKLSAFWKTLSLFHGSVQHFGFL